MNKLYNGLELDYTNWTRREKHFWHEKAHDGSNNWEVVTIGKDGQWETFSSDIGYRPNLGKFKHILKTDNNDFEFRVFEKGILKVLKESAKIRVQKELDADAGTYIDRNGNLCKFKWQAKFC